MEPTRQRIDYYRHLLDQHRSNARQRELQIAMHGEADAPPSLSTGLRKDRKEIARCKKILRDWNVTVGDCHEDGSEDIYGEESESAYSGEYVVKSHLRKHKVVIMGVAVMSPIVVGLVLIGMRNQAITSYNTHPSTQTVAESNTRVSIPLKDQAKPAPQGPEEATGVSYPSEDPLVSASPSPGVLLKPYNPAEEITSVSVSPDVSTQATVEFTAQSTVLPTVSKTATRPVPTAELTAPPTVLAEPTNQDPIAAESSYCGSKRARTALFADDFLDGILANEKRTVIRDNRVDISADAGYLHIKPLVEIDKGAPASFYKTRFAIRDFCAILFVSNIVGSGGAVSIDFRYTESEKVKFKYYSFWVYILGEKKGGYYFQSAMPGKWTDLGGSGFAPKSVQDIRTISVKCSGRSCAFFINDVQVKDIVDRFDEEDGAISFHMKGDIRFDVKRVEIYEP